MGLNVYDRGGNQITFPDEILDVKEWDLPKDEIFDDLTAVIEKPMMMFEKYTFPRMLYYLRAVG